MFNPLLDGVCVCSVCWHAATSARLPPIFDYSALRRLLATLVSLKVESVMNSPMHTHSSFPNPPVLRTFRLPVTIERAVL